MNYNEKSLKNLKHFEAGWKGGPGRPKGVKPITYYLRRLLEAEINVKDIETGEIVKKSGAEGLSLSIYKAAIEGNVNAFIQIRDMIEGKIVQKTELTGSDGEPLKIQNIGETDQSILDNYYKRRKESEDLNIVEETK